MHCWLYQNGIINIIIGSILIALGGKISKDMWTRSGKLKNPYRRVNKIIREEGGIDRRDPRYQQFEAYENLSADEKK